MWKCLKLFFVADYAKALKEDWNQRHWLDPDLATLSGLILVIVPPILLLGYYGLYDPPEEFTVGMAFKILVVILAVMSGCWLLQFAREFFERYLRFCSLLHLNPKDTSGWKKWALTDMACKLLSELGREVAAAKAKAEVDGNWGIGGTNVPALAQSRLDEAYRTFSDLGVVGEVGIERFILVQKENTPV